MTGPIGGDPIAALENELLNLVSVPGSPAPSANFIRRRLQLAFLRAGEAAILVRGDPVAPTRAANLRVVFRMTMSSDFAGEIRQNDMDVFLDPEAVLIAGFPLPLAKGDHVIRWPNDSTKERVFTFLESPMAFVIGGEDVHYRGRVRG